MPLGALLAICMILAGVNSYTWLRGTSLSSCKSSPLVSNPKLILTRNLVWRTPVVTAHGAQAWGNLLFEKLPDKSS